MDRISSELMDRILTKTQVIVAHKSCADGFVSALFLRLALGTTPRCVFLSHGREREELVAEPGMLFCDMSPPEGRRDEFADVDAIVLDHHASARSLFEGERPLLGLCAGEAGVSGAVLAHAVVERARWRSTARGLVSRHRLARLVGIYDTWQRSSPDWADARAATEMVHFVRRSFDESEGCLDGWDVDKLLIEIEKGISTVGRRLVQQEDLRAKEEASRAHRIVLGIDGADPLRVAFVESGSKGVSLASDHVTDADIVCSVDLEHGADLGRGFRELSYRVSMRSRGARSDLDLSRIAKALGGGGHRNAAGFRLDDVERSDPYSLVREAISRGWSRSRAP